MAATTATSIWNEIFDNMLNNLSDKVADAFDEHHTILTDQTAPPDAVRELIYNCAQIDNDAALMCILKAGEYNIYPDTLYEYYMMIPSVENSVKIFKMIYEKLGPVALEDHHKTIIFEENIAEMDDEVAQAELEELYKQLP